MYHESLTFESVVLHASVGPALPAEIQDHDNERAGHVRPVHAPARESRRVRSVTDSAGAPASQNMRAAGHSLLPGAPVVGMVGGGQLARMTAAAAIGLGIGFRV